eukprot:TRINITY_DN49044_c0_g1_i1.p1 TRINITY_DN49044_c0_g1~~TRINITY_DN49044_c0_g1_i1.p1  ORF type:complete len:593 (+),score=75.66 TRINITY_DN49044_c0_g1_i1:121-1899(+)
MSMLQVSSCLFKFRASLPRSEKRKGAVQQGRGAAMAPRSWSSAALACLAFAPAVALAAADAPAGAALGECIDVTEATMASSVLQLRTRSRSAPTVSEGAAVLAVAVEAFPQNWGDARIAAAALVGSRGWLWLSCGVCCCAAAGVACVVIVTSSSGTPPPKTSDAEVLGSNKAEEADRVGVSGDSGIVSDSGSSSGSGSVSRDCLLDNAKSFAMILVVFHHYLLHADLQLWLVGSEPRIRAVLRFLFVMDVPTFTFVSGLCSQGPATWRRVRAWFTHLLVPTCLWFFVARPLFFQTLQPRSDPVAFFQEQLRLVLTLETQSFVSEWYLISLVLWRGSVLALWSHLRPCVAVPGMVALSLVGGYLPQYCPLRCTMIASCCTLTLSYLPYFALGYAFPRKWLEPPSSSWLGASQQLTAAARGVLVGIAVLLALTPEVFGVPFDAFHTQVPSELDGWAFCLAWTRRVALVAKNMSSILPVLLLGLPRAETPLTWIGRHTLYVYLCHQGIQAWLYRATASLAQHQPHALHDAASHVAVLLVCLGASVLTAALCASSVVRALYGWCLEPHWLERLCAFVLPDGKQPAAAVVSTCHTAG